MAGLPPNIPYPQQVPGFDLPQAEYFALAPGRSIALGPRLTVFQQSAVIPVPANAISNQLNPVTLVPRFQLSSAVYLARAFVLFAPTDNSAELEILSVRLGLGAPAPPTNNIFLDIGTPLSVFSTPGNAQIAIMERDALVVGYDLGASFWVPQTPLVLWGSLAVKNLDATNPHSYTFVTQAVYHAMEGFVQ